MKVQWNEGLNDAPRDGSMFFLRESRKGRAARFDAGSGAFRRDDGSRRVVRGDAWRPAPVLTPASEAVLDAVRRVGELYEIDAQCERDRAALSCAVEAQRSAAAPPARFDFWIWLRDFLWLAAISVGLVLAAIYGPPGR